MSAAPASTVLVDERGKPLLDFGRDFPRDTNHYAASQASSELAGWMPRAVSADAEWLNELEIVRARVHDTIRNNGMVSGAIQTQVDNITGAGLRLSAKPDWLALGVTDADLQDTLENEIESAFSQWADDVDFNCDAARQLSFGGLVAQACRSYLTSFEILATSEWLPRPGTVFSTAIQTLDPMRLSNPFNTKDTGRIRGGVEVDALGAPVAYHFSSRVPNDPLLSYDRAMLTWTRVPKETTWGRRNVLHVFDQERPGQSRGKGGIVSVLARGRMLDKNEQAHLQAAIQNAMFATVVVSPLDWQSVGAAVGAGDPNDPVLDYVSKKASFHKESTIRFGGTKIPHLYPGEELKHIQATHPHANFDTFERIFHRYMAAGMNMTYEQFSRDYSQTNYSGHRAALLDYWRFVSGRRSRIAFNFARMVYVLVLEEIMDRGMIKSLPAGLPSFLEAKTAWCRCDWIGPGRGQIDPLKEAQATREEYAAGLTTLEIEAAERGRDWREIMTQRAQESRYRRKLEGAHGLEPGALEPAMAGAKPPSESKGEDDRPAPAQPAVAAAA